MENINQNIYNIIKLWETVSKPFNGYATDAIISYSQVQNSEWPNKIWSNQKITPDILNNIKMLIETSQTNLRFIDFEYDGETNKKLIENSDFELTSSLPGMHLRLTKPFDIKTRLKFKMVTETSEAKIWCAIFKLSFNYIISEDLVIKNMNKVHFYIAFENEEPVGVVKLYLANSIAGIYSLGVPAHFRGKGYAKEIMHFVLNKALQQEATLATLQASKSAHGMYERLGFKKDFKMNTYKLQTQ